MRVAIILFSLVAAAPLARAEEPLRQAVIEHFDRNHDGRLEPRERRQAARALRRIARQLVKRDRAEARMRQRVIQRYDLNHDGNVGPEEMPPGMARRLRPMDRNRDGWVDDRDFE